MGLSFVILGTVFYAHKLFVKPINKEEMIARVMNYPIPDVIQRCKKDHGYSDEDMQILEKELKRYLVMSEVLEDNKSGTGMYSEDVDNLWHSFILFTKDYAAFCDTCFGKFIHHVPGTGLMTVKDFQAFVKNYANVFGEEVHAVWFLDSIADDVPEKVA